MPYRYAIAGAPEVNVAVRVRGLSQERRFFDEKTSTTRLTREFIVIRLKERVELDFVLFVNNARYHIGGNFRVAWINTRPKGGMYSVGLELLDAEGEIWDPDSLLDGQETEEPPPVAVLECQRCQDRVSTALPEAEITSLGEGFIIARTCETCKSTTAWTYCVGGRGALLGTASERAFANGESTARQKPADPGMDQRKKGRAPIRLAVKIIRHSHGMPITDVCETINVSRSGVCFTTLQRYELGETLQVVVPYDPNSVAIPVQARVLRQDDVPGTNQKRVAVQLMPRSRTSW